MNSTILKRMIVIGVIGIITILILALIINFYVINSTKNRIISEEEASKLEEVDCIVVLGAGVSGNKPSPMLEDRIMQAISLYQNGTSKKLIMSGDHGKKEYDEVNVMKKFAIEKEVPSEAIFMDHAGFSTYDSIYRAKEIFGAKKIVVVTQRYHLYRALYIAKQLGIEAYGVKANPQEYGGKITRELREILARDKDWLSCIFKPKPAYLGETIPVSGNGDSTNDK